MPTKLKAAVRPRYSHDSFAASRDDNSPEESSEDEVLGAENKEAHRRLRSVLRDPLKREVLIKFTKSQENKVGKYLIDLNLARIQLWVGILEYKHAAPTLKLAKAHFLWQRFFDTDPYEKTEMSSELVDLVRKILWKDEDGADSTGLVTNGTFNSVELWCQEALLWIAGQFFEEYDGVDWKQAGDPNFKGPAAALSNDPGTVRKSVSMPDPSTGTKEKDKKEKRRDRRSEASALKQASKLQQKEAKEKPVKLPPAEAAESREETARQSALIRFSVPMEQWTPVEVVAWLKEAGLGQFAGVFKENIISGLDLIELEEEDLDQMGFTESHMRQLHRARGMLDKFQRSLRL